MVYDYKNVPEEVYLNMRAAFSKGTFLNRHIKHKFEFKKIDNMQSLTVNENMTAEIHYIKGSININSNADKVWKVLTDPEIIKQYIGSDTKTDWQPESEIMWEGEHAGQKYQNKGRVLENEHEKSLKYTFQPFEAGTEENSDDASIIKWTLENSLDGLTTLTYQRENIPNLEERDMLEEHLPGMLDEIKRLAEE